MKLFLRTLGVESGCAVKSLVICIGVLSIGRSAEKIRLRMPKISLI